MNWTLFFVLHSNIPALYHVQMEWMSVSNIKKIISGNTVINCKSFCAARQYQDNAIYEKKWEALKINNHLLLFTMH